MSNPDISKIKIVTEELEDEVYNIKDTEFREILKNLQGD